MRSPRIVTLGVIGLLRLARLAKTVRMGDHDDVHIDLKRHPLLLHLYAWSITFDYFFGYFGKVTIPRRLLRRTVICDDSHGTPSSTSGSRRGSTKGSSSSRKEGSSWTSRRNTAVCSSSRPRKNCCGGVPSCRSTHGSPGGSDCMPSSRADLASARWTAGTRPNLSAPRRRPSTSESRRNDSRSKEDRIPDGWTGGVTWAWGLTLATESRSP